MSQVVFYCPFAKPFIQNVAEWIDVNAELFLQVSGKVAQLLSRLDSRPGKNDSFNTSIGQCFRRHGSRAIAFAGPCRTNTEGQAMTFDGAHISFLGLGAGFEGLPRTGRGVGCFKMRIDRVQSIDICTTEVG